MDWNRTRTRNPPPRGGQLRRQSKGTRKPSSITSSTTGEIEPEGRKAFQLIPSSSMGGVDRFASRSHHPREHHDGGGVGVGDGGDPPRTQLLTVASSNTRTADIQRHTRTTKTTATTSTGRNNPPKATQQTIALTVRTMNPGSTAQHSGPQAVG